MRGVLIGLLLWVVPNLIFFALLLRASGKGSSLDRPERRFAERHRVNLQSGNMIRSPDIGSGTRTVES